MSLVHSYRDACKHCKRNVMFEFVADEGEDGLYKCRECGLFVGGING